MNHLGQELYENSLLFLDFNIENFFDMKDVKIISFLSAMKIRNVTKSILTNPKGLI